MSRRSLPILLVLLAAIATGVVWIVSTVQVDQVPAVELAATPAPPEPADSAAPTPAPLAETPAPAAPVLAGIESASPDAAREAIEKEEEGIDMSETWTVEGRVQLPPGTPADEHVQVLASVGTQRRAKIHSRSDLGPDGSFRVSFSKGAEKGQLVLEARYLFLPIAHDISPGDLAKLANPLVLRPEIGGCIHGRVHLARNALEHRASLVGHKVDVYGRTTGNQQRDWTDRVSRDTQITDELEFEFGGLPASRLYTVNLRPKDLVDASADSLKIQPGRVLTVDLDVELGARISGRIVDEKGAPVEEAQTMVQVERGMGSRGYQGDEKSAADGSFHVFGIGPGKVTLTFTKTGYTFLEKEIGLLGDGDVREGVEIVLQRGQSVTGRVLWPDQTPAAGARIEYRFAREEGAGSVRFFSSESDQVTAAADGAFEISGLGSQAITLTASAEVTEEGAPATDAPTLAAGASPAAGAKGPKAVEAAGAKDKKSKPTWKAYLENVAPGTRDLVITVRKGATVRGRAVDDLGAALEAFRIRAEPIDGGQEWERRQRAVNSNGSAGEFALEGLHEGEWDLVAEAKEHAPSTSRRIRFPAAEEEIVLVLPRAAKVSGIVVDRDGKPVPRSRATARQADAASRFNSWNRDDKAARCDAEGRFEIADAPPGPVKIVATAEGMAESAPLPLELAPGQIVADLSLVLRRPGRITGEILDDTGRPIPGRSVNANATEDQGYHNIKADDAGRFEIEGMSPGRYWVSSGPSEKEMADVTTDEERQVAWTKFQKQATVEVVEGETVHVVLGGAPKDGVKVHGTIYAGAARDRTVPGVALWVFGSAMPDQSPVTGTSDAEGKYAIVVPKAGEFSLSIMNQKRGTSTTTRFTVPPEKTEFEHDILLPGGRIGGRVIGMDGKPVARMQVSCAPEQMTAALSSEASYGNTTTDDAGAFVFDGLNEGTYRFEAGSQPWEDTPSEKGKCVRGGVVLEKDGRIDDLELRLQPQCRVEGLVLGPDGQPVAGATVYARDESGNVLQRWPPTSADASGRFKMDGLLPGKVTFAARTKRLASPESAPVKVRPEETTKVELSMRAGTRIRVIVHGNEGRTVGAFATIADASGRDVTMMYAYQEPSFFGEATPGEGQLIGPVPSGRYRVTATNHDRTSASEDVAVSGEEEVVVTIQLGG